MYMDTGQLVLTVSTHSRPKAAGFDNSKNSPAPESFNTQPPEGGWYSASSVEK
nr:hypothetical protein [uncultured Neisseria sp.]